MVYFQVKDKKTQVQDEKSETQSSSLNFSQLLFDWSKVAN